MSHRKSVMLLLRIARGESVGIVFGTPVHHKTHHAQGACITIYDGTGVAIYGSPVTYYYRACYTNLSFLRFSWLCAK